jgi:ribosome maturation factor RimP
MHGGSRHGTRGQAHSGAGGTGAQGAPGKTGPGKAPGKAGTGKAPGKAGTARGRDGAARPAVPLPDADRLTRLLEPVVRALGMDLESVRVSAAGRRRLLRVIVDGDGGVNLDAIALASRELSARLDSASEMGELPYTLEVSSPGVDRPLTEPRHWRRAIGRLVVVPLAGQADHHDGNGVSGVHGRIAATGDRGVTLDCDGVLRDYGYSELGPGKVQVEFGHLEPGEDEPDEHLDDELYDEDAGEED